MTKSAASENRHFPGGGGTHVELRLAFVIRISVIGATAGPGSCSSAEYRFCMLRNVLIYGRWIVRMWIVGVDWKCATSNARVNGGRWYGVHGSTVYVTLNHLSPPTTDIIIGSRWEMINKM